MECRDQRHSKLSEESQNVAPGAPPEYPVFMLQTDYIDVADIQKIRGCRVAGNIILE